MKLNRITSIAAGLAAVFALAACNEEKTENTSAKKHL